MENYVDPNSHAENAGGITLSREKYDFLRDNILKLSGLKKAYFNKQAKRMGQYLKNGDTQPAVVVSESPFIIAVYSDELDGVQFVKFPEVLAEMYNLHTGSRLVCSNVYTPGTKPVRDIKAGPGYLGQYCDFTPTVQLFLADEENYVRSRTDLFPEEHWRMVEELAQQRFSKRHKVRDGFAPMTKFRLLFMIF